MCISHYAREIANRIINSQASLTFPPSTSSPIIRHAAVWMVLELRSSADTDDVMTLFENVYAAAEL